MFALMCDVVGGYWQIASGDVPLATEGHVIDTLKSHIARLNKVYNEFDKLKLLGDAKGYCLFESQREDLYAKGGGGKSEDGHVRPENFNEEAQTE